MGLKINLLAIELIPAPFIGKINNFSILFYFNPIILDPYTMCVKV